MLRISIDENGLYKCKCPKKYHPGDYLFHCKNWTFRPYRCGDKIFMVDTYFDSWDSHIEVTQDNVTDFEHIFNFDDVKRIGDHEIDEYENTDLYVVATNSGGYTCGKLHWVKKNAVKSKRKIKEKIEHKIELLNRQLKVARDELVRIEEEGFLQGEMKE